MHVKNADIPGARRSASVSILSRKKSRRSFRASLSNFCQLWSTRVALIPDSRCPTL